jgi:TetR/AcrR family transcriptional regulator
MAERAPRGQRRQQMLEVLARMLENSPGQRITTAALAKELGVSEAALYRHFASKAQMFEALLGFIEDSIFGLSNRILENEKDMRVRIARILELLLGFSERNPGMTRILMGDALVGENERLLERVAQFFRRVEAQLRQVIREGQAADQLDRTRDSGALAEILLTVIEGRMHRYLRTGFEERPTRDWLTHWPKLEAALLS